MLKKLSSSFYQFLLKMQKYTKTDNIYLFKHGSWLMLGQVIASASSFLSALLFANLIPKETYGLYKFIISTAAILAIPTLDGIDTAVVQAVSRGYEGSFKNGLKTKIKWGTFGALASLILAGYYAFNHESTLALLFCLIAGFLPLMDSFEIYSAFLNGRKYFQTMAKCTILLRFVNLAFLAPILLLTKNIYLIVLFYFLSNTLMRAIFLIFVFKKFSPNNQADEKTIPYGKHVTLTSVIDTIASYLDQILIFHLLGPINLAVYSMALTPTEQLKSFLKNISPLAFPKLAVKDEATIKKILPQKMGIFLVFIAVGIVIYIVLSPYFYQFFFPRYLESVRYSQALSISLLAAAALLPRAALRAKMATKKLYQLSIISPVIQIILLIVFINLWGLWGIVLARVVGRLSNLAVSYVLVKTI